MEAAIVSKMQTLLITLGFPEQCLLGFFILEKQLASQNVFLVRFELFITAYLFLVLYRSTSLQSGNVWPSGWVVWKVANGPGFEPSAKGGISSKGPKLVFRICAYVGATSAWGSFCIASVSFHSHIDYNKVLKIHGAQWPVCLSHAVPVSGSELCPTK